MDIIEAEKALLEFISTVGDPEGRFHTFHSVPPEGTTGIGVFFESGEIAAGTPADFSATLEGVFNEPDDMLNFAGNLWKNLPCYNCNGFSVITPEGKITLSRNDGKFTISGKIHAVFA